jgi:hypothetical protein
MLYTKQCKISFLTNERFKSERKERVEREREREKYELVLKCLHDFEDSQMNDEMNDI